MARPARGVSNGCQILYQAALSGIASLGAAFRQLRELRDGSHRRLEENFVRLGCTPSETVGVADWDTAVLLAELGIGHAVLPSLPRLALSPSSEVRTVPIPALSPITVG